jgi:hypothetical protein
MLLSSLSPYLTNVCLNLPSAQVGADRPVWSKTEATLSSANPPAARDEITAQAPSVRLEVLQEPKHATLKLKRPVPADAPPITPMGPPPVPLQRKVSIAVPSKKRARDVDDILGDEVDAIQAPVKIKTKVKEESHAPPAITTKKARRSPEKQVAPSKKRDRALSAYLDDAADDLPPPAVATSVPVPVAPANPFAGQPAPSQGAASLPFRQKRAKQLITLLQKEPSAVFVRTVSP